MTRAMGGAQLEGQDVAGLWRDYSRQPDEALRTRLVTLYLPFARIMAGKLYAGRTHREVEFDDYLQFARVGLVEAVDRFEPARGFKFETFAASRISGAILSGMASYSEIHEQVAARQRIVAARLASLRGGAAPADDAAGLFGYLAEMAIGLAIGFALDNSGMYQERGAERLHLADSYTGVELRQLGETLNGMLDALPGKHRQVIAYHYLQQIAFEEIAGMLQLSRGRIAQIHKEALLKLREAMQGREALNWSG
jgi:RNA polymerase sigma factor for flagellar operon FliA